MEGQQCQMSPREQALRLTTGMLSWLTPLTLVMVIFMHS